MSSTRKTPRHLRSARKLPGVAGAAVAAVDAAAADVVGDAAGAVAAAEAAARPGDVAAGARSAHRPTTLTESNTNGRVLLDPASFCFGRHRERLQVQAKRCDGTVERVDKS
jgi:hypothetical protein